MDFQSFVRNGERKLEDDWRRINKKTNDSGVLDSNSTGNIKSKTDQNLRSDNIT